MNQNQFIPLIIDALWCKIAKNKIYICNINNYEEGQKQSHSATYKEH